MKLITRSSDYAIRALSYMARNKKKLVSAEELVCKLEIPRPFLRRILQRLHKGGVLKAGLGREGGFKLKKSPGDVNVVKVMEIFQGKFSLNECVFKKKTCPSVKNCRLKKRIDRLRDHAERELRKTTLSYLIGK